VPSPVATQKYDDMEGQFAPNPPPGKLFYYNIVIARLQRE